MADITENCIMKNTVAIRKYTERVVGKNFQLDKYLEKVKKNGAGSQ